MDMLKVTGMFLSYTALEGRTPVQICFRHPTIVETHQVLFILPRRDVWSSPICCVKIVVHLHLSPLSAVPRDGPRVLHLCVNM